MQVLEVLRHVSWPTADCDLHHTRRSALTLSFCHSGFTRWPDNCFAFYGPPRLLRRLSNALGNATPRRSWQPRLIGSSGEAALKRAREYHVEFERILKTVLYDGPSNWPADERRNRTGTNNYLDITDWLRFFFGLSGQRSKLSPIFVAYRMNSRQSAARTTHG